MKKDLLGKIEKISKVVNAFISEKVQLRVLDVLLKESLTDDEAPVEKVSKRGRKKIEKTVEPKIGTKVENTVAKVDQPVKTKRGRKPKVQVALEVKPEKVSVSSKKEKPAKVKTSPKKASVKKVEKKKGLGASGIIQNLIAEGYFKERRELGEIVQYSGEKFGVTLIQTDISGLLGRLVKGGKLKREKGKENGKYEYYTA